MKKFTPGFGNRIPIISFKIEFGALPRNYLSRKTAGKGSLRAGMESCSRARERHVTALPLLWIIGIIQRRVRSGDGSASVFLTILASITTVISHILRVFSYTIAMRRCQ